jgi:hypothetical protein
MSLLRFVPLAVGLISSLCWAFLAIVNYPIIVPADSDLGSGALLMVADDVLMIKCAIAVPSRRHSRGPGCKWPWQSGVCASSDLLRESVIWLRGTSPFHR